MGLEGDQPDAPIYLRGWSALLVTLVGLAIVYLVGSQIDPPQYAFMSIEQTDTTTDSSLPREINGESAEILSTEIDLDTMQAGDFQVTTASGKIGSLTR